MRPGAYWLQTERRTSWTAQNNGNLSSLPRYPLPIIVRVMALLGLTFIFSPAKCSKVPGISAMEAAIADAEGELLANETLIAYR